MLKKRRTTMKTSQDVITNSHVAIKQKKIQKLHLDSLFLIEPEKRRKIFRLYKKLKLQNILGIFSVCASHYSSFSLMTFKAK